MTKRRMSVVAAAWLGVGTVPSAALAAVTPLANEFQVNRFTPNYQNDPAVALRSDAGFVVVWTSLGQDGYGTGIFGRRYDAAGAAQAVEFQVNSSTSGYQRAPAVGMDGSGRFVVVWQSFFQGGSGYGIFARRFDSAGAAQGDQLQVDTFTEYSHSPAIAMNQDGAFVVAWVNARDDGTAGGIFARRFDASGTLQAAEFQVNAYTTGLQNSPAVALDGAGRFVVAWQSDQQDGSSYGVFAKRFDASGLPQGTEFQVTTYTPGTQRSPAAAVESSGDFVITWESLNQDGSNGGIFAQRFESSGVLVDAEFQVNTVTVGRQKYPAVTVDDGGDFVVAWQSQQDGDYYGVFARAFKASGTPQSVEFQVNSYTPGFQVHPAIDRAGAHFIVAWSSNPGQDGAYSGVFAQRFVTLAVLDIDGDGEVAPLSDGLLVLRFLFGFTGSTLLNGAVGAGCTRCDAASISGYLDTLI